MLREFHDFAAHKRVAATTHTARTPQGEPQRLLLVFALHSSRRSGLLPAGVAQAGKGWALADGRFASGTACGTRCLLKLR